MAAPLRGADAGPVSPLTAGQLIQLANRFVYALSFNTNGSLLVVGAFDAKAGSHTQQSAAEVFARPGGGWATATETAKLTASDGAAGAWFGYSAALSGDGQTILAGSYYAAIGTNNQQGAVYLFHEPGGGWATATENVKLIAMDGTFGSHLGAAASLSGDGAKIVAGAVGASVGGHGIPGATYVFGSGVRVFLSLIKR